MRMENHVIRFELLSALFHSNLCWLQIYSRFAAFLTPWHPISRGRLLHQSQPGSNLPSIFHTLLSFFTKLSGDCQLHHKWKIWILNTITQTSTKKATPKKTEMRSGPKYSQELSACVKNGYNIIATDGVRFLFKKKSFEKGKKNRTM